MKKGTISKLLSITLALSMTLGSGSMAVFADDVAPAAEEIETAVLVEEDADDASEAVVEEDAEAAAEETAADTEVETVIQPEEEAAPEEAAPVEEIAVEKGRTCPNSTCGKRQLSEHGK